MQVFRKSALAVAISSVLFCTAYSNASDVFISENQTNGNFRVEGNTNVSIAGSVDSDIVTRAISVEGDNLSSLITISEGGQVTGNGDGIGIENAVGSFSLENSGTILGDSSPLNNYFGLNLRSGDISGNISNLTTGHIFGLQNGIVIANDPNNNFTLTGNITNSGYIGGGSAITIYSNGNLIGDITNTESGQLEAEENSSVILVFGSQNGDINNYGNIGGQIELNPVLVGIGEGIRGSDIDNAIDISIPTDLSYAIKTNGRTGVSIGGTLYGNINNTGNIFTSHNGIEVFGDMEGTISNSGEITTGYAGIWVFDTDFDGLILNEDNGIISSRHGIYTHNPNSSIINNGTIKGSDITFQSSLAEPGYLNSSGITVFGIGRGGTITNNGDIFSNIGINTSSLTAEDTVINNTGNIESAFTGIDVSRSNINHISNSGSITSQNAISASDSIIESITNTGSINASTGIYAHSGSIGEIVNTGTITAKEAAISVIPEYILEDEVFISSLNGNIINSGIIDLPEYDGRGISVATGNGDIINPGSITATAISEDFFIRDRVNTNIDNYTYIADLEDDPISELFDSSVRIYQLQNTNTYAIAIDNFILPVNETFVTIAELEEVPSSFMEMISADNAYLFSISEDGIINNEFARFEERFVRRSPYSTGIYISDNLNGQVFNSGIINIATGTGIELVNGSIINGVVNTGAINAPKAIDFSMANEGQTLEQRSGILNGEIIGSDEDDDNLFASGGTITGDITGFETIQVTGSLDLDGNVLNNTAEDQQSYSFVVSESGRLNLVSPTSINANYSQQGAVNVYPSTTGSPYIQIDGTARIENGAVINVLPATLDETSYSILSATNGLSVAENILRLQSTIVFDITQVVTNDVLEARITRANMAQNLLSDTGNANIATFADTLQTALNTLSGDALTNTLEQLNQIETSEEFVEIIESSIPGLDNETQTALLSAANAVQGGAFNNILSHLSDLRNSGSGVGTGDLSYSGGIWVKALHTEADQGQQQDGGTTYNGYKARSKGFTLGGDIELSPEWTVGTAFSFADVTVDVKDSGNNTTMDSYQLSLYGDWQRDNWFANGILNVGYNNVDSKRYAGSTRYEADYGSKQFGMNVTGGYQFWFNDKDTLIEPQLVLNYSLLDTNSYKERSQAGDVVEVSPHNQEVIELGAGVRLSQLIETDRGPLLPEARLFAFHDFKADKVTQNVTAEAFNLPLSFRTVGIEPEKTRYQAGLGVSYWMDNNFSLSLNYDHTWQSDFKADSVQAKVRYDF